MRLGAVPHGTYNGYSNYDCRCAHCSLANNAYFRERTRRRRLEAVLPLDTDLELHNASVIRTRILTWQAVHDAGRAVGVCDQIIARRPLPPRLLAAVLA